MKTGFHPFQADALLTSQLFKEATGFTVWGHVPDVPVPQPTPPVPPEIPPDIQEPEFPDTPTPPIQDPPPQPQPISAFAV